jgi:hypothetical protein
MTIQEKQNLLNKDFDELWVSLWGEYSGLQYRGEKQISKNKYLDSITLSDIEYNKLLSEYAQHEVDWMIDCLNNYKMSSGVRYKSDYHAICKWVKDAFKKAKVDFVKNNNTFNTRMQIIQNEINNTDWENL